MRTMTVRLCWLFVASLMMSTTFAATKPTSLPHGGKNESMQRSASSNEDDPLSGEWRITFRNRVREIHATFTFILDGSKVTGTAYSDHTGAGTIRDGKLIDGKLSFALDFKKHESVTVTATLKDGKLIGEFVTEGMTVKWQGEKSSSE